jgi:Mg2+-importing ATPase
MRCQQLAAYWSRDIAGLISELETSSDGLGEAAAAERLARCGENRIGASEEVGPLRLYLRQLESPLVLILIFGAAVTIAVRDFVDAVIILAIVLGSTLLAFSQEFRASGAVRNLRSRLALKASVRRAGVVSSLDARLVVPGDIVLLAAGNLVPADGIVLAARDFLVSEAALSGESFPVEKTAGPSPADAPLSKRTNAVFLGTSVRSGTAEILVVHTGNHTAMAAIAQRLGAAVVETDFQRGLRRFGYLLTRIMMLVVMFVFTVNLLLQRPLVDSLLFAVALAVGLTPELLPAIVSVTLSAGARQMARSGVIVRRLDAIESLGSVDILATDKTGTLTSGVIALDAALDPEGRASAAVMRLAAINARFETGIDNPIDAAIIAAAEGAHVDTADCTKIDEIPYDFMRKRLTIVVDDGAPASTRLMVTKGAFAAVIACCDRIRVGDQALPLDAVQAARIEAFQSARGNEGYRLLAVASRRIDAKASYARGDETQLVLEGFLMFLDPLKEGIRQTVDELAALGIGTKIISGDNRHVAAHVGAAIGLDPARLLTGRDLDHIRDEALWHRAETADIFAEVDPQQKERIIRALQHRGHVVAYMGDGINDAPALLAADVGVSVDQAVDVARESADMVLLERDLEVLRDGVIDGRTTFANTLKYIQITTSANFGNMISMAAATLYVPFLPLVAKQILLNNFLSDFPSIALSTDNVDADVQQRSQRWDIGGIRNYMLVFGLISTIFDLLTFYLLLVVFRAGEPLFQSAWFVVSLLTELAVVFVLRTRRPCWQSRPSRLLTVSTLVVAASALLIPYVGPLARPFGFVPLPVHLLLASLLIVAGYIGATELAKQHYYRR